MWIKAIALEDVPLGTACAVDHDSYRIGLFHTRDGLFALDNACPHAGADLHIGTVKGGEVLCPFHHWPFRLRDGWCRFGERFRVDTYPTQIREDWIWIELPDPVSPISGDPAT
ncbi:Rieske (2Fe-2S) protein [Sulfidibacter corallicola]|uniref:Rieske (2Fe-2S) protein n=1 Tax=Sulfidibacter corallicola TaxID=2818388 RepID=A0A8A4TSN0_SULCO|nr:Rieske (2Fe-2S) protein [Sulfidibacter corallicola]QTD52062.1 Rieske (2Fe-2S) protein [Sulfidibacter corallicola]